MNNSTLDFIDKHTSISRYQTDPLPASIVETIITAAQCASPSSNLQAYSVVAVTDAVKRNRLSELCGNQSHIREAPAFLVCCADLARLEHVCQLRGYTQVTEYTENFLIAVIDVSIAAQNAALAAESLGLGICFIGSIRNNPIEIIKMLSLPRLTFPIIGMTLGWLDKQANIRPRLPLKVVLHWETYDRVSEYDGLNAYDAIMAATGVYKGRQVPVPGKPGKMEDYSWMEHSAWRVSPALRTELCFAIRNRGFSLK